MIFRILFRKNLNTSKILTISYLKLIIINLYFPESETGSK